MANSITCPKCGMTSYHPKDIEYGYCGNCHEFTGSPIAVPNARLKKPQDPNKSSNPEVKAALANLSEMLDRLRNEEVD